MAEHPIKIEVLYHTCSSGELALFGFDKGLDLTYGVVWDTTVMVDDLVLSKWVHPATREELLTDMAEVMFMIFNDEEPTNFVVVDLDTTSAWRSMGVGDKVRVTVGESIFEALCEESGWSTFWVDFAS